jgi:NTE family protein
MLPTLFSKLQSLLPQKATDPPAGKPLHLALQRGGAHGAFTWGVLDQLLETERIAIQSISGTSAGAINAIMLADGLARGGPAEAKERLAAFWRAVSFGGTLPELQRRVVERLLSFLPNQHSPIPWLGEMSRFLSPSDLNPLNINPLQDLIERFVDFDAIRGSGRDVFIAATNVLTGEPRTFSRQELSAEVIMASACLPVLFRAVEIDGVPYWDGGYTGNPSLVPFLDDAAGDVLIVQINPHQRRKAPTTVREIATRIHEITFNAPLLAELRAFAMTGGHRRLRLHRIVMDDLGQASDVRQKLNMDYEFLDMLRQRGRHAARRFLDAHGDDIGRRSTIALPAVPESASA